MKKIIFALFTSLLANFAFALVNINTASVEELDTLPKIGKGKATAIVEYREKNGPFKSIEDLTKVSGIKGKTFEGLKDQITVSGSDNNQKQQQKAQPATTPKK